MELHSGTILFDNPDTFVNLALSCSLLYASAYRGVTVVDFSNIVGCPFLNIMYTIIVSNLLESTIEIQFLGQKRLCKLNMGNFSRYGMGKHAKYLICYQSFKIQSISIIGTFNNKSLCSIRF